MLYVHYPAPYRLHWYPFDILDDANAFRSLPGSRLMCRVVIPSDTVILPAEMPVLTSILTNTIGRRSLTTCSYSSEESLLFHQMLIPSTICLLRLVTLLTSVSLPEPLRSFSHRIPCCFTCLCWTYFFFCLGNFLCNFDKALANCACLGLFLPSLLCPHLFVFIPSGIILFKELCLIILSSYLIVFNLLLTEETHWIVQKKIKVQTNVSS